MTDNEKRAHDLALKAVDLERSRLLSLLKEGETASFSVYSVYKQFYDKYLELLDCDYAR